MRTIFLVLSLIILGGCFSENKSENKSDLIPAGIAITTDKTTKITNPKKYISNILILSFYNYNYTKYILKKSLIYIFNFAF